MATKEIFDINCVHAEELYARAKAYWEAAPSDNDGMLGGFAHLHKPDITQSRAFVAQLFKQGYLKRCEYALDCGAGIGRVTKDLLLPAFDKVDMVDVVGDLVLVKSKNYIGSNPKVEERFACGLQDFDPPAGRYDLIWVQWVTGHLTSVDFVAFFKRCLEGIRQGGLICWKDNIASANTGEIFDEEDCSWTRTQEQVEGLFEESGLAIARQEVQKGFPKGMFKVIMYCLRPKKTEE